MGADRQIEVGRRLGIPEGKPKLTQGVGILSAAARARAQLRRSGSDQSSAVKKFESGGYSLVGMANNPPSPDDILRYKSDPTKQKLINIYPAASSTWLGFNFTKGPFASKAGGVTPGQPTGGAYLRMENSGELSDKLLSASADVSKSVELHEMKMQGDVMRMRQVATVDIPAHQSVVLEPGGVHIMLVGLKAPLKEGERFPMTLKFERAGEVKVDVVVESVKAGPMKHDMKH